ncbi:MAG: hypothetical protein ACOX66_02850 [Oscillospiraceae bacterium]|jgi:hypothetical protein
MNIQVSGKLPDTEAQNMTSPCAQCNRDCTCACLTRILCFLAFLFAGALGLILGAYFAAPLLASISAVIVGAVILAVLIIALIIYMACIRCRWNC